MSVPPGPQGPYYSGGQPPQDQYGSAGQAYGAGPASGQSYGSYPATDPYGQVPQQQQGGQFQSAAPYQATTADFSQPPKKNRPWLVPVVAIATFLAGIGIGVLVAGDPDTPAPTPVPPVTVTTTSQPPPVQVTVTTTARFGAQPSKAAGGVGDGVWQVGVDIEPGEYRAVVPQGSSCYVAMLGSSDEADTLESDYFTAGETVKVTVTSKTAYFQSKGCGTWTSA